MKPIFQFLLHFFHLFISELIAQHVSNKWFACCRNMGWFNATHLLDMTGDLILLIQLDCLLLSFKDRLQPWTTFCAPVAITVKSWSLLIKTTIEAALSHRAMFTPKEALNLPLPAEYNASPQNLYLEHDPYIGRIRKGHSLIFVDKSGITNPVWYERP